MAIAFLMNATSQPILFPTAIRTDCSILVSRLVQLFFLEF